MTGKIALEIIETLIGILVASSTGYLASKCRNYRTRLQKKEENEKAQNDAIQIILQNQLTRIYYKYEDKKEIPDYIYKNWQNMKKMYYSFDGNEYVHTLDDKIKTWRIIKTDILDD